MANVQQFATWASIAAKIDTFPKLPSGGVDVFLTKAEILAKGGGLVKIEDGYSDNSFVALSDVSQYVVEWRYEFYFEPTEINLDYIGNAQTLRLVSTKQKFTHIQMMYKLGRKMLACHQYLLKIYKVTQQHLILQHIRQIKCR